ncbi:DUF4058 family protein [Fimbriiglobus ruber]|uniref:DUF4058 domain-containing protein n=1 Tax=Fimbriiglobus ruber TaxID=1908690 RepID=A0A225DMS9_9BACT|nr:DUF4058 family protein [Fimbriiglobus ruber]OWK42323.1 hypothetical protein FRUB_04401 [Fimbriiglobus ruber]
MPIHDWTRVKAGTFHNFHYRWIAAIMDRLNAGLLPAGFFAMAEQRLGGPEPDVISLQTPLREGDSSFAPGGPVVAPRTRFVERAESVRYAQKTNRVAIHHDLGTVVAVIEIVSPGNKDSRRAIRSFARKSADLIRKGVHVLVVDLFPPSARDPQGIHKALWSEITTTAFTLPADKPLTLAAYEAGELPTAYVEPVAVGDRLPDMPLFLYEEYFINVPLEETYQTTWNLLPGELRQLLE